MPLCQAGPVHPPPFSPGDRLGLLATVAAGDGGWADLPEPIIVRAGEAFIAVPELPGCEET